MAQQPHAYWQHQFLKTASLPTTNETVLFLSAWQKARNSGACNFNPIDLSHREPGSSRCSRLPSGKYARNYTDTASAAAAFADQLTLTDYPILLDALQSGDPYGYNDVHGVEVDLGRWGSTEFQVRYAKQALATPVGGGSGRVPQSKNVGAAWGHLMRTLARDGHRTIVELQTATSALSRIERRLRRA